MLKRLWGLQQRSHTFSVPLKIANWLMLQGKQHSANKMGRTKQVPGKALIACVHRQLTSEADCGFLV